MNLGTPWMLLLLPPLALTGCLLARAHRLQRDAACRLQGVAPETGPPRPGRRDWLALAALTCMVLALARPQWSPRPYDVERRGRDLVIALDVSRSMLAADVPPSRLEAARIAIHEALPALAGQRIALVTFAGSATVRVPLTLDREFVRYMLERADPSDMDLGSTSLQAAVEKAVGTVLTDAARGQRDLVVFTDGEDHLSNIEKTAALLAKCGARVLIIGIGDPVQGARVPDAAAAGQWMKFKDNEVVSRLDEGTLTTLSGKSSNVTYYPARTRPFDLVQLYDKLISGATDDVVVGKTRQVRYSEGYPYLLGLSVALWLAAWPWRLPATRHLLWLVLLLPGCGRHTDDSTEATFKAKFQQGGELLQHAQEQSEIDVFAARSLLLNSREAYLRAALLRPGNVETARQITGVTGRLKELDAAIEKQRDAEKKRHEGLAEIIGQLEKLTRRQARLSQQSGQLLARQLVTAKAELDYNGDRANDLSFGIAPVGSSSGKDNRLASRAAKEQRAVHEGTAHLSESITFQQNTLRQLLAHAYGDTGKQAPTELDPVVDLLGGAQAAQNAALASLVRESVQWPKANSALHMAAGRMEQAIEELRGLLPPAKDQDENNKPPLNQNDYDEELDGSDSEAEGKKLQSTPTAECEAALALRALPTPKYTSAEILAEEAANQQRRAKQKAARAAAKVEKNW
jgi:Ca-activated chloride channel homolog